MYEMIVSSIASDLSVGVFSDKKLRYFYREDARTQSLVGSVYYGTVIRVLPGTQSAFIDIGKGRTGFLHVKDCVPSILEEQKIEQLVIQGQNILVQVLKDPIGEKGARLTTQIALPSVYCVYHPYAKQSTLSQKIVDPQERLRLQAVVSENHMQGVILRTLCEGVAEELIVQDYKQTVEQWSKIRSAILNATKIPVCVWSDLSLAERVIRDFGKYGISCIFVNNQVLQKSLQDFINRQFLNEKRPIIIYKQAGDGLSRSYAFSKQLLNAMQTQLELPSGGAIVIEQTESMVTIDVNTSGFVGKKNVRETVLKTNQEAIELLAQQIPLRELGGIIVIDFIDMHDPKDRSYLFELAQKAFLHDTMPVQVYPLTPLGLMQMTRKRQGQSYLQKNTLSCQCCGALGQLLAPHVFLWVFLEKYDAIIDRDDKVLVILGRQDVLNYLQRYENSLREYKKMVKMIWRYQKTHDHDNQIDLRVVSKSEFIFDESEL